MKFCKDCKYFDEKVHGTNLSPVCMKAPITELIRGGTYYRMCYHLRSEPASCGESASWFEPVDKITSGKL